MARVSCDLLMKNRQIKFPMKYNIETKKVVIYFQEEVELIVKVANHSNF